MADTNVSAPAPRKRRNWLRSIIWVLGVLVLLLVVVYFVATSSAFFKAMILPKVSKALNAQVTVSDASISPFSQVVLHDLKVQTTGSEPLVAAPEVRLRYSLMDIIGGHINVDEVALSSPTIVLVQNPDGTSNLDPILQGMKSQPQKPVAPAAPAKPLQLNVKKVALTDATVRQVKLYKGNSRDVTELSHINVALENLQNGQSAKLSIAADVKMDNNPPAPVPGGSMEAKINGGFTLALTSDLKPASIQGNTRLEITRATGALAQAAALSANFDCDITPTEIKQVALRFQKADTRLGELNVSGPFNLDKTEGRITVQLLNIDKNLLNLAGASSGVDFGPTTISSTNTVQLANAGNTISASGQFNLHQFQLTLTNQSTPPLELAASYDVSVDRTATSALVRVLTINGTLKGNQLLHGELSSPMTVAWGNVTNAVGDSALNCAITHLDLTDWKPFVGNFASAGDVNMKLQLLSQQAGKQLTFDLSSDVNNLTAGMGNNQISQAAITLQVKGKASDLNQIDLTSYSFTVARQNQQLVTLSGSGTYDQAKKAADLQLKAQVLLARLLQVLPRQDLNVSSGTLDLTARITQNQTQQNVSGNLALTDFTGQVGSNSFRSFGVSAELNVGMTPDQVKIQKLSGTLTQGSNPGGAFDVSGTYGLSNKTAQLAAKLSDFNQNGLRPFLEPMLADKKLVSIAINATASVEYDPNSASSIKAELQATNLVVNDPKGQFPSTPLGAKCLLDASVNKQVTDIRQCQLGLTPTTRATNAVNLTGHFDMSQTNAIQGNLKLAADSLDLTSYYDLFVGQQKPANASRPQPAPQTTSTSSSPVAAPDTQTNQLPFRNFTADASVGHLYLREVDISNFQATAKIDGGHIVLNPCKLALNGAPLSSTVDLDLGVPGYKYDLSFSAQAVPLAPLVDSFEPDRKGQLGGTFNAQAKISGIGTSGASLQKSLNGQFDFGSTNLNLSVINIKSPLLKTVVNVVATIPDLVRNPEGAVSSLLQGISGKSSGGLTDELSKSPINSITARGNAASGSVNLQQATVQSSAFRADANGTVTLAPMLTNSAIRIPVSVSLSMPLSQRFNLVPAGTPTNAPYAKLPDFLTLTGTVGNPDKQINKMALLSLAAKGIGGTAGSALQGLGGILGGSAPANTNAPSTQPPTNQTPVNKLLNNLFGPKKK